ncbi:ammonium transporter [Propionicimonas sp.]|uniref:ammonium transporter n=1 Tax=Propionicimonas sp. TaxID=1955623 RepID=UPI0039E44130
MLELNSGDTAWILTSAALVLLMTPGLALFYGGMVRAKSVLNMMMMSFISMGVIGVLWVLYGYSMAFGNSVGGLGIIGNPLEYAGLQSLLLDTGDTYPGLAFVAFQACFAIITVALVSGAIADRASFGAWTLFTVLWGTFVYFPAAHWVFAFSNDDGTVIGGWIANVIGALDFAGGTAIHINAGTAALVLALVLGPRIGFGTKPMRPHNMTLVMLGAALLWFGWFGFNAGSAVSAGQLASLAWVNTLAATAAAMLAWLIVEKVRDGHPTSLGAASGIVAGLVAITPACGSVSPIGALFIGAIAGAVCAWAISLKYKFGYDDSLDVVGVHLVGGLIGTLLIGFFADPATSGDPASPAASGLFYGGGFDQLWRQAVGAFSVMIFSFVMTYIIALIIKHTIGWRISPADELSGIDLAEHSEAGYDLSPVYYTNKVQRTLVLTKDDLDEAATKTGASK